MPKPTLDTLPPPPAGKTGWPWTDAPDPLPDVMADGRSWPRITVVTPSYNQGQFIEETIRSILLQGYPNLEYFIMDGGSSDNTVDVIRQYEPWITRWVSETDRGQTHAINKGWQQASGSVITWLNSDDYYPPHALRHVGRVFAAHPNLAMVFGDSQAVDEQGGFLHRRDMSRFTQKTLLFGQSMAQPAVFNHIRVIAEHGLLKEALYYVMDFEFFLRAWHFYGEAEIIYLPHSLANERKWSGCKTLTGNFADEWLQTVEKFFRDHPEKYRQQGNLIRKAYSGGYRKKAILQARHGQRLAAQANALRAARFYPGFGPRLHRLARLTIKIWLGQKTVNRAGRMRRRLSEALA